MIYLDPKSDVAFKKLFGNMAHKNILISFLNSVLECTNAAKIVDVVINDPANIPDSSSIKYSIVDVHCTDQNGHQYIVEMQVVTQKDYAARAQYYSALALGKQLAPRGRYNELVPVLFVGILDFELFAEPDYLTHHLILNKKTHTQTLKHLEFHFVELCKFNKKLDQLDNDLDKWIYILKSAEDLSAVPTLLKEPNFTEAFDLLAKSNWSNQEILEYEKYLDAWRSEASRLESAEERGIAKGITKGKMEIALQLLDILDIPTIAQKTGLSIEQIQALKKVETKA